ncbi:hypothetical protein OUZ56_005881 [Daphnia magna]|uniref:Uncharacterized protein n=1 Tax=Daphnia magna TaxID=35525 RepID=A0ABQ9YU92_9CRUS|nr:hypothetical protein OUZ56_005881 [Daphnia magna]
MNGQKFKLLFNGNGRNDPLRVTLMEQLTLVAGPAESKNAAPPSAGALHLFVRPFDERGTHDDDGRGGAAAHRSLPSLASIHPKSCQCVCMTVAIEKEEEEEEEENRKRDQRGSGYQGGRHSDFLKNGKKKKIRNKTKVETTPPPPLDLPCRKR